MKEKKYHLPESNPNDCMLCEPSPSYAHSRNQEDYSATPLLNWDDGEEEYNTNEYPLGRSLEQIIEHCANIDKHLDDPKYGIPIEVLDAEIDKMIAEWR